MGIAGQDALLGHPVVGGSWEGFIVEQLLAAVGDGASASFYRSAAGDEIDLVLENGSRRWAIEIKRSMTPTLERSFHAACAQIGAEKAWVVYLGVESYPHSRGATVVGVKELAGLLGTWTSSAPG